MPRAFLLLIALLLLTVSGAALSAPHFAHAEDEEQYVDLWTEISLFSHNRNFDIHVGNEGNRSAYGVVVEIKRKGPAFDWTSIGLPDGTCLKEDKTGNCLTKGSGIISTKSTLFWNIPLLEAREGLELSITSQSNSGTIAAQYDVAVTSVSHENETRRYNNSDQLWVGWFGGKTSVAEPDYSVEVRVDDRIPSAGDTVNFAVFAKNHSFGTGSGSIFDGCVNIRLTDGLTAGNPAFTRQASDSFTSDPATATDRSYETSTTRECGDKSGADGFFLLPEGKDYLSIMTLPVTVPEGVTAATLGEQCLTAEIFATPPSSLAHALDDPADNKVEYCLGGIPPLGPVFDDGEVKTWTFHACKYGTIKNKCDTAAEVQVEVFAVSSESHSGREHTFANATALIHVKDAPGRVFDTHSNSVTNGTTVSWMTNTDESRDNQNNLRYIGTQNGVKVGVYRKPLNAYSGNWTDFQIRKTATGLDGNDPPGKLSVRLSSSGNALWALDSTNSYTFRRTSKFNFISANFTVLNVEFETLGTYVVDATAYMLHDDLENSDATDKRFEGTGRTIFHVGPIAELGVGDYGAASPFATTEQVAFTVLGINNRDEDAESGKIEVELPAGTTGLTTVPAKTGVFDSSASPPTWTWDISELALAGSLNSPGTPDGVPVTLIVEGVSAGATASAKVDYDPYEVCIGKTTATPPVPKTETAKTKAACDAISGATWHSGTVFDYDDTNNAATLTARRGAVGPSLASSKQSAVVVRWQQVKLVNGQWVKEYEVQRANSDSPASWSAAGTVPEVSYFTDAYADDTTRYYRDAAVDPAKVYLYRVRAVNGAGVKGAWSRAAASPAPPAEPTPAPARPEPANRSPQFEEGASASRQILENSESGTDVGSPVLADDPNGDKLTYALEGADAASFAIVADTGQIRTYADLDYETKRRYKLKVTVTDGKNSRGESNASTDDFIEVSIAVTNQGEKGSATFSETLPVVGTEIKASLTDPDGGVVNLSWTWERSSDAAAQTADWTAIAGAKSDAYAPVDADAGYYLRATASYDDAHGPDKSASAAFGVPVAALTIAERYDGDGNGTIGRSEALQAAADYRAGAISYAEAVAVARLYFQQ